MKARSFHSRSKNELKQYDEIEAKSKQQSRFEALMSHVHLSDLASVPTPVAAATTISSARSKQQQLQQLHQQILQKSSSVINPNHHQHSHSHLSARDMQNSVSPNSKKPSLTLKNMHRERMAKHAKRIDQLELRNFQQDRSAKKLQDLEAQILSHSAYSNRTPPQQQNLQSSQFQLQQQQLLQLQNNHVLTPQSPYLSRNNSNAQLKNSSNLPPKQQQQQQQHQHHHMPITQQQQQEQFQQQQPLKQLFQQQSSIITSNKNYKTTSNPKSNSINIQNNKSMFVQAGASNVGERLVQEISHQSWIQQHQQQQQQQQQHQNQKQNNGLSHAFSSSPIMNISQNQNEQYLKFQQINSNNFSSKVIPRSPWNNQNIPPQSIMMHHQAPSDRIPAQRTIDTPSTASVQQAKQTTSGILKAQSSVQQQLSSKMRSISTKRILAPSPPPLPAPVHSSSLNPQSPAPTTTRSGVNISWNEKMQQQYAQKHLDCLSRPQQRSQHQYYEQPLTERNPSAEKEVQTDRVLISQENNEKREVHGKIKISRNRSSTSATELRMQRIRQENASKERLVGLANVHYIKNLKQDLRCKQNEQNSSNLRNQIEERPRASEELVGEETKQRILSIIQPITSSVVSNLSSDKPRKEVQTEIKGYIQGLVEVLHSISRNSSKQQKSPNEQLINNEDQNFLSKYKNSASHRNHSTNQLKTQQDNPATRIGNSINSQQSSSPNLKQPNSINEQKMLPPQHPVQYSSDSKFTTQVQGIPKSSATDASPILASTTIKRKNPIPISNQQYKNQCNPDSNSSKNEVKPTRQIIAYSDSTTAVNKLDNSKQYQHKQQQQYQNKQLEQQSQIINKISPSNNFIEPPSDDPQYNLDNYRYRQETKSSSSTGFLKQQSSLQPKQSNNIAPLRDAAPSSTSPSLSVNKQQEQQLTNRTNRESEPSQPSNASTTHNRLKRSCSAASTANKFAHINTNNNNLLSNIKEEEQNSNNDKQETLLKQRKGRSTIKTINPYKSLSSSNSKNKKRQLSESNRMSSHHHDNPESQQQLLLKKLQQLQQQQQQQYSNNRIPESISRKNSQGLDGIDSMWQERIGTKFSNEVASQGHRVMMVADVIFADENQQEVSQITPTKFYSNNHNNEQNQQQPQQYQQVQSYNSCGSNKNHNNNNFLHHLKSRNSFLGSDIMLPDLALYGSIAGVSVPTIKTDPFTIPTQVDQINLITDISEKEQALVAKKFNQMLAATNEEECQKLQLQQQRKFNPQKNVELSQQEQLEFFKDFAAKIEQPQLQQQKQQQEENERRIVQSNKLEEGNCRNRQEIQQPPQPERQPYFLQQKCSDSEDRILDLLLLDSFELQDVLYKSEQCAPPPGGGGADAAAASAFWNQENRRVIKMRKVKSTKRVHSQQKLTSVSPAAGVYP